MSLPLEDVVRAGLSRVGWYDPGLPSSYLDGAEPMATLPIARVPRPIDALTPAALDAATDEALAPRQVATPAGHEPGLMADVLDLPLTAENIEAVLDELVRPALNADGGDITLVEIKDNDVYVRLVGACNTCPSSIMTMKMGVERLLQDEFPTMRDLIQVDSALM